MPDYGKLSKRSLDEMIAGARVDVAPYKRDAMDFVLWKPSKPGEPAWPSPAGIATQGRPGWHIECSAMSWKHLGETFDIHGGGIDLVFPHHENEIAQSRCAFHSPVMANYWMHNGFLQVEGEKMSKSEGNFFTIRELLADWHGQILRFNMLRTHYRQPIDWTEKGLEQSRATLEDWWRFAATDVSATISQSVLEAVLDDLNTPKAIAELHAIRNRITSAGKGEHAVELAQNLAFLGFGRGSFLAWEEMKKVEALERSGGLDEADIEKLIDARNAARKARDFKEADRIRDELRAMGIELEDKKDGTTIWKVTR
jgi:cysteinyl-tRNA synthetase